MSRGRKPKFAHPSTMTPNARHSKAARIRRKGDEASEKEVEWLALMESFTDAPTEPTPEPTPAPAPVLESVVTAEGVDIPFTPPAPAMHQTAPAPTEPTPAPEPAPEPPSFVNVVDPNYEPRMAYAPNVRAEPEPEPAQAPPQAAPPPSSAPEGSTMRDAPPPAQEHQTPPPPEQPKSAEEKQREEQLGKWREHVAVKVTVAVQGVHEKFAARGWPAITEPAFFSLLPWAVTDYLYERFPDSTFSHKDLRNATLATVGVSTVACGVVGYIGERKKKSDQAAKERQASYDQAQREGTDSDEQPDGSAATSEPKPETVAKLGRGATIDITPDGPQILSA